MNTIQQNINTSKAKEAFSRQAIVFDELYGKDSIIAYKRERVRERILKYAKPGDAMLELNCGTGEDALFFSELGYHVYATDVSEEMLAKFKEKIETNKPAHLPGIEQCSFENLNSLKNQGPFDIAYSNFGGLNCANNLDEIVQNLGLFIKPGGTMILVIISRFCLWEILMVFKGKFKTAFRRFFSGKGRKAHIEGSYFKCWYYSPSYIVKALKDDFDLLNIEGLCSIVPPSYIEGFGEKYPRSFSILKRLENKWKANWPWNSIGDYFIISLQKKSSDGLSS